MGSSKLCFAWLRLRIHRATHGEDPLRGRPANGTPVEVLDLKPGEVIRMKSFDHVVATLDCRKRNRCWTRKESFIKAIGEGLSCSLDSFEVALNHSARLTNVHGDEALEAQWWMADLPGFAGYAAAVTARKGYVENVRLRVRELANADLSG